MCRRWLLDLGHEGSLASFSARARLNLLKTFKFELFSDLRLRNFALDGVVCVDLCICHADIDEIRLQ